LSGIRKISDLIELGLKGKRILLRADLNVPMTGGRVTDATRIERTIPTIKALTEQGARVVILSHFGRPTAGYHADTSLAPLTDEISNALGKPIRFGVDCIGSTAKEAVDNLQDGEVILLENLRFHAGEEANDREFADKLASLGDYFVNDAFSCSHRAHASIVGLAERLPSAAGINLASEVEHLEAALNTPQKPVAAIVGGSKVSTKIDILKSLVQRVDYLMIGGGMANTFLYALGNDVAASLCEKDHKTTALEIIDEAKKYNCEVMLPVDVVAAENFKEFSPCRVVRPNNVPVGSTILDVGAETVFRWTETLKNCKTVVWNGPLGAFEITPFDASSITLARTVAGLTIEGKLLSIAGGGDVLAALARAGLTDSFSYISTAGGAFLEWLEGKELPGISVLRS
jgi:phosphoglycerate kinase